MATIVIPARWASTRFPAKPLALIRGANGEARPLLEWTWRIAQKASLGRVVIATDDVRIETAAMAFGAEVLHTSRDLHNGTERVAAVAKALDLRGIIVNLQGDSCLMPAYWLRYLVEALDFSKDASVATLVSEPTLREPRPGEVSAAVAEDGRALWFARNRLPAYYEHPWTRHFGVYAYRARALDSYGTLPTYYEQAEGLEQLRFLEGGLSRFLAFTAPRIKTMPDFEPHEVNSPEDVPVVEKEMARWNLS
jgi:3-deoxy-manno-octulosonate cytidylyltransferase (CMP-KDO synthetase)